MKFLTVFFLFLEITSTAQNRNMVWCFGDSAGIDFSSGNPIAIHSAVKSRGSCASISDSNGNLLFYTSYNPQLFWGGNALNGEIYNREHRLMSGGDSIFYRSWYQEVIIVPFPGDSNKYYIFSIGMTSIFGLYYTVVDMSLDSSRGAVTMKNIQLLNVQASDGINAVKHGNGRDWWVIFRRADSGNDEFYEYLVSPSGISGPTIIHAGIMVQGNLYSTCFSPDGNKIARVNVRGLIDLLDFDRCSGNIILYQTISPENTVLSPFHVGVAFSQNESYLYVSALGYNHPTYLIQFDLTAPVISVTADTLWYYTTTDEAGGQLKLAPDGKIYMACVYVVNSIDYPYADTSFNTVNNNLSVINYPDSLGVACGFSPFSFNLGSGRCYYGLPNNPDYELGAVVNSMCDTVTAVAEPGNISQKEKLHVFYHQEWQVAFINAENLKGKNYSLSVFDLTGRAVYREDGLLYSQYFTKDLSCGQFSSGLYIVSLQTEKEKLVKRFVKD